MRYYRNKQTSQIFVEDNDCYVNGNVRWNKETVEMDSDIFEEVEIKLKARKRG